MNNESLDTKDLSRLLGTALIKKTASTDPLDRLRKSLRFSTALAAFVEVLYGVALCIYPFWPLNVFILVILLFNSWGFIGSLRLWLILALPNSPAPVLQELERYYRLINRWIRLQTRLAIFVYPFSIVAGGLFGAYIVTGEPVTHLLQDKVMDGLLIFLVIVITPLGTRISKFIAFRYYGQYLQILRKNLDELRADKEGEYVTTRSDNAVPLG
jgi:hypothetical protein